MTRRQFLQTTALLASNGRLRSAEAPRSKAPFRILYNNDTTNLLGCTSPWHAKGAPFSAQLIEASVDEVAGTGVDAHLLAPGLGWVPFWPSKVLPLEEHYRWIKDRYGVGPDTFGKFTLEGGDLVRTFVERCRARGQAPFISFRINDVHHKEHVDTPHGAKVSGAIATSITRQYAEHPEWRIGPGTRAAEMGQNWAVPEVRAFKFELLRELCENYDLAGVELDFMRFDSLFRSAETTRDQRAEIVTGFIREVRALLDRTTRSGRRWLSIRIPCWIKAFDSLGLDLPALVREGVNLVNVSASYFTQQQHDFAAIRALVPDAAVYLELCHSIWNGDKLVPGYDTFTFRRATTEQLQTTAHTALARGADGVSLFNFAYYREHGGPGRGPFSEPPFEVIKHLADRDWLARQPQHYFLAPGWNNAYIRPPFLPRKLTGGQRTTFPLDLAPPAAGWKMAARLRVQTLEPLGDAHFFAKLNGHVLTASADVSEPFAGANPAMLGTPETLAAWTIPADLLRAGANEIELTLSAGDARQIAFLDLATS